MSSKNLSANYLFRIYFGEMTMTEKPVRKKTSWAIWIAIGVCLVPLIPYAWEALA